MEKLTFFPPPSPKLLSVTGPLHGRCRRYGLAPDKRCPSSSADAHARAVSELRFFSFSFFFSGRGRRRNLNAKINSVFKNQVAAGERARKIAAAAEVVEEQAEVEAEAAAVGYGSALRQRRRQRPATTTTATEKKADASAAAFANHHHPLEPLETRVASLLQYLAILACAFAGPLLRQIPRGAIAGYFAFMALEWVGDSEMVDRLRWLLSDAVGRARVRRPAPAFVFPALVGDSGGDSSSSTTPAAAALPLPLPPPPPRWTRAPTRSIAAFTAFQVACVVLVYALTWIPVAGILFVVPILLFVPLRTFVLPRIFGRAQIELLDGP